MVACHCPCHCYPGVYRAEPCSVCGHHNSRGTLHGWDGREGWTEDPTEPIVIVSLKRSELDREFQDAMADLIRRTCEALGVPSRLFPKQEE